MRRFGPTVGKLGRWKVLVGSIRNDYDACIMRNVFLLLVLAFFAGCISSERKMNRLQVGMTRAEVTAIMGTPHNVRATAGVEYMIYRLMERGHGPQDFFVRIRDNKVDAFGQPGDFNTPSIRVLTEQVGR